MVRSGDRQRRMKGGNNEDKIVVPLFPRLYVNGMEKGGPRAAHVNEMARNQQLTVRPQGAGGGSSHGMDRLSSVGVRPVRMWSSSHGNSPEKMGAPRSCHGASDAYAESIVANANKSILKFDYRISHTGGNMPQVANCNLFELQGDTPFIRPSEVKVEEEIRVPTILYSGSGLVRSSDQSVFDNGRCDSAVTNSLTQLQAGGDTKPKRSSASYVEQKAHSRTRVVKLWDAQEGEEHKSKPSLLQTVGKNTALDEPPQSSCLKRMTELSADALKSTNLHSPNLPCDGAGSSGNDVKRNELDVATFRLPRGEVDEQLKLSTDNDTSAAKYQPCPKSLSVDVHGNPPELGNACQHKKTNMFEIVKTGSNNGDVKVFGSRAVDSVSGVLISPDDVVGVIGQTHFLKATEALLSQQSIFSKQVFELHRLIKVQKSLAVSGYVMKSSLHSGNSSNEASSVKTSECMSPPRLSTPSPRPQPQPLLPLKQQPIQSQPLPLPPPIPPSPISPQPFPSSVDCRKCIPSVDCDSSKDTISGPNASTGQLDPKLGIWCYPPHVNQWLVPIMSPSAGLIYKPYAADFLPPMYSGFGPISPTPVSNGGGVLNSTYNIPASHHQGIGILPGCSPFLPTYYAPCYASKMHSSSPLQLGIPLQLPVQGLNCSITNQSSRNLHSEKKDSELHSSIASSSPERTSKDTLPLFPVTSPATTEQTCSSGQLTRVIKVVPRNPRLATESAARIFQSIQKERREHAPCL